MQFFLENNGIGLGNVTHEVLVTPPPPKDVPESSTGPLSIYPSQSLLGDEGEEAVGQQ